MFFAIRRKTYIFAEIPDIMDKRLIDKIVRYFATQPVVKAWVFGSYAREEAHSGSDIDILVVFDKEAKVSLMLRFPWNSAKFSDSMWTSLRRGLCCHLQNAQPTMTRF